MPLENKVAGADIKNFMVALFQLSVQEIKLCKCYQSEEKMTGP